LREQILRIIKLHNGIREVDLALAVMNLIIPQHCDPEEYHKIISDLVSSREINSFEYIEPAQAHIPMMIKSIFFSKDTEFLVNLTGASSDKMVRKSRGNT